MKLATSLIKSDNLGCPNCLKMQQEEFRTIYENIENLEMIRINSKNDRDH